ncbi:alpha/beta hydrolase [Arthrobacter sp. SDTb3-6]|uniref:alpha/beta hydrolase n=1 Tax=Arthrobacter sp. SDTb3-6 TaxID=2713571 RepID=UPI00159E696C|nr:alpha/beta hydrolase [Arthrobacter sp. SDTb3-6]
MNFFDRTDPQLHPGLDFLTGRTPPTTLAELVAMRRADAARRPALPAGLADQATMADHVAPGGGQGVDVALRSYRPAHATGTLPCLYWIHGGGMVAGTMAGDDLHCLQLALSTGLAVVSVEYRLAPEHPFPAAVDDAYQGLLWTVDNAGLLGVDPARLAIGGASAGGGIAAGLALRARDQDGPALRFQYLAYPMLDDRDQTPSNREFPAIPSWNRKRNTQAWSWLLGPAHGTDQVSEYAAPARAGNLSGLPPALIQVGELDLFRDEDIEYAARLLQAGVPTALQVYPGFYHGADALVPEADVSVRLLRDRDEALVRALA